jgi:alpha-1,3-mannosyltransferase
MAVCVWPKKATEAAYLAALLICFLYILFSSPFGQAAHSRIKSTWQGSTAGGVSQSDKEYHEHMSNYAFSYSEDGHPDIPTTPSNIELDASRLNQSTRYINAILDPRNTDFDRLQCPRPFKSRYKVLKSDESSLTSTDARHAKRFFFALNLYQCAYVLPRLLGSIIEVMRFLGPENCVLSIIGGRSDDGTTEILVELREKIEAMNVTYYFGISDIEPWADGKDRVTELARLRNMALAPLTAGHVQWANDATVAFINDVSICADDILELLYQKHFQRADMVCAMDWQSNGAAFYDSWIGRSMNGDMFIEVPQSGSFDFMDNLFWNDDAARYHVDEKLPLQVFSCWNGAVAFKAEPILLHNLKFRASYKGECYAGEPTLFCKDLWHLGYPRIAIVPSVNLGYDDAQSKATKQEHGYASQNIQETEHDLELNTTIEWQATPPQLVKCQPDWRHTSWAPWDDKLDEPVPYDWSRSGYFHAKKPFDHDLKFETDDVPEDKKLKPETEEKPEGESKFDELNNDSTSEENNLEKANEGHGIEGDFHGDHVEDKIVGEASSGGGVLAESPQRRS